MPGACLRLVFPWLGIIVCLCAPLLFSVWLLSALWASFSWHLFLASHYWSLSHCFFILLSFVFFFFFSLAASSVSLFLLCSSLRFGWSSGPFVACVLFGFPPLWVLAREVLFLMSRVSAPRVGGCRWSPSCFSFRAPLLSFLPLGASCDVGIPCMPSALLLSDDFRWLCLSSVCGALSFFYPGFTDYLARPAFVSPCFRYFSYTASSSSSALSSSSVP